MLLFGILGALINAVGIRLFINWLIKAIKFRDFAAGQPQKELYRMARTHAIAAGISLAVATGQFALAVSFMFMGDRTPDTLLLTFILFNTCSLAVQLLFSKQLDDRM